MRGSKAERFAAALRRWLAFNLVGLIGVGVQLGALAFLRGCLGLHYLWATALAVEVAVLHNFVWHELWTWRDRTGEGSNGTVGRLARFNSTTGAISIGGNIALMYFFAGVLGLHYALANMITITLCSLVNFLVSDRIVFVSTAVGPSPSASRRRYSRLFAAAACFVSAMQGTAAAAELGRNTVLAWDRYVLQAEQRRERELGAGSGFLALDFLPGGAAQRARILSGEIAVQEMRMPAEVADGMVHHWLGCVFVPGVTLTEVFDALRKGGAAGQRQEDVLESRVLAREGDSMRIYLRLVRSKIVTVTYSTEHQVSYQLHNPRRASSHSRSLRIVELANANTPGEREKPEGRDSGFLWRLNSYWRYEQVQGGVLVECESLSLSRSIPAGLDLLIRPIIRRVARESMSRTLSTLRGRFIPPAYRRDLSSMQ